MDTKTKRADIDVLAAWAGLGLGIVGILLSEYYGLNRTHLGCAICVACLGYLATRHWLPKRESTYCRSRWQTSDRIFACATVLFLVLLLASVAVVSRSLYRRPATYFWLFASAAVLLTAQIALLDLSAPWRQRALLGQILLLGISLRAGAFFLYPTVSGNDPFVHQRWIDELIATGKFPQHTSYASFPIVHLLAAALSLMLGSTSKVGLFGVSVLHSLALLAAFPIGKRLLGIRTGLLAALLLSFSDYQILWGIQIIPNTLGIAWFLLAMMALVKREADVDSREKMGWTISALLFLGVVLFTHTLSTFVLLVTLSAILTTGTVLKWVKLSTTKSSVVSTTLPILLGVAMPAYWMHSFPNPERDFFTRTVLSISSALLMAQLGSAEAVSIAGSIDAWAVFAGEAGWTLLLIPALMGALSSLNQKLRRTESLIWAQLMALFLATVYVSGVMGIQQILPARWVPFLYLPACLLAASLLSRLLAAPTWKALASFTIVVLLSATVFLMATSPSKSALDSPLYAESLSVRPGFYTSELAGMRHAEHTYPGPLAASAKSRRFLQSARSIDPRQPESYERASLVVMREFDIAKGFFIPFTKRQLIEIIPPTPEFLAHLDGPSRVQVYDSGTVQLFLSTSYVDTAQYSE
jgi:hypothetical protein